MLFHHLASSCNCKSGRLRLLLIRQQSLHQHNKVNNLSLTFFKNTRMRTGVVIIDIIVITDIAYEMTCLARAVSTFSAKMARAGGSTIQTVLKVFARKRKKDNRTSAFLYVLPSRDVRFFRSHAETIRAVMHTAEGIKPPKTTQATSSVILTACNCPLIGKHLTPST